MTQKQNKLRGFTIVELLIVIVVIAILAAITIVAYNGIQSRARTSAGQATANAFVKKAEAFNTLAGAYPTYCQLITNSVTPTGAAPTAGTVGVGTCVAGGVAPGTEAKIDSPNTMTPTSAAAGTGYTQTVSNNNAVVGFWPCGSTTGVDIYYWDYTAGAIAIVKAGTGC